MRKDASIEKHVFIIRQPDQIYVLRNQNRLTVHYLHVISLNINRLCMMRVKRSTSSLFRDTNYIQNLEENTIKTLKIISISQLYIFVAKFEIYP